MNSRQTYFENLDALRAIAALAVVFAHMPYWLHFPEEGFYQALRLIFRFGENGGRLGVIFFFILSGFLITYLLLLEKEKSGRIHIGNFYMRRILRIWPLYFLSVFVGFIVYPFFASLAGYPINEHANGWMYLFFAANFDHIYNAFPVVGILGVQWSVCVEEQFYLVWPVLVVLLVRSRFFPWVVTAVILFSEFFFVRYMSNVEGGAYHLLSCFRFLALGAFLAWLVFNRFQRVKQFLDRISKAALVGIYLLCLTLLALQAQLTTVFPVYDAFDDVIPAFFFAFVILEQNFSTNSFLKFGSLKVLTWLGKISYGIYLNHMIAVYCVLHLLPSGVAWLPVKIGTTVGLTIAISYLSYHYFERYFLKWKQRF